MTSQPKPKALSQISLVAVGNEMSEPRRAAFVTWKGEDLAAV